MGNPAEKEFASDSSLLESRLSRALQELEKVRREKQELEERFKEVITSKSWRLTEPLRQFTKLRKTVFPLIRSRRVNAKAQILRSLQETEQGLSINGASPCLKIDTGDQGCPHGWVSLEATVRSAKGTMFFYLYMGTKEGFSEAERCLLSFDDGKIASHPVFIPAGITELRLDVYDFDGNFRLQDLALRELGSLQLIYYLFSRLLIPLRDNPSLLWSKLRKAFALWREGGFWALRSKLFGSRVTSNYSEWVSRFDDFSPKDRELIVNASRSLTLKPLISVVTPVHNPPARHFRACLDSVINQAYENWELCLADDASTDPEVRSIIEEYQARDSRVKVVFREKCGHIAEASNSALSLATGEFVAFLDHDDELTVDALFMLANEINNFPQAGLIYSDEDKKTSYGLRVNPHFKSDWNPELMLQQNYVCHLCCIRKELIDRVGRFRPGYDGAQDWDLILRVAENLKSDEIRHIPHILYHWTIIESSTAQSTSAKPYVMEAQKKAVEDHLLRTGQRAKVSIRHSISNLAVEHELPVPEPLVSIIILTKDKSDLLSQCVESIFEKTRYRNFEVIIIDNGSLEKETFDYFNELRSRGNVHVLRDDRPFNFSALNNYAAKHAKGEILAFLNNDLEVISPGWLGSLVGQVRRKGVGAAGARLLFPNNLLQHAGVIIGIGGVAGHNHKGRRREDPGYFNRAILSQNLSAVTAACILVNRDVFDAVKGFDENLSVAFNDVDLCLRIREEGFLIVYEPAAELYHFESASRGYENTAEKFQRFEEEILSMKNRWGRKLLRDPYYNPNLTNLSEDFVFAFPPRVNRPWKV